MVKLILFLIIYCIGCVIGSFSEDVNGIGSSISLPVAYSASGIENSESFSNDRAKGRRALALLVPFDDYDQSGEERHKSKRCWRARAAQKMRLSFEPDDDTENRVHRESGKPSHRTKYNSDKLYDNEKRSAELSEEGSLENGRSREDNPEGKFPYLKIVPLKNSKTNLKEFLRTDQQTDDDDSILDDSGENTDDFILRRIKNHLNSDDYKVLALVGKRAGSPRSERRTKYICYCREDNCSGGNCQRMMYRPCSRCRNSRPVFVGKVNSNRCSDRSGNYHRYREAQSTDARTPLNVPYPASQKEVLESPANENIQLMENPEISTSASAGVKEVDFQNFQQNLPPAEDRRYQFSYDTPRVVLAKPNVIRPMEQYRIVNIPVSAKSPIETDNGIPGSQIPAGFRFPTPEQPAANEYRSDNFYSPPNQRPFNQWVRNSYYPSIGQAGNSELRNKNHQTGPRTFNGAYQTDNRFIGSKFPYANQRIFVYPQAGTPGSQFSKNFDTVQPKMPTNLNSNSNNAFYDYLHDRNGFGSNMRNGVEAQAYPQQQHVQVPTGNSDHPKNPESSTMHTSADLSYDDKNLMIENSEKENSQFKFGAQGYDSSTENHFGSISNLETNNNYSAESQEDNSDVADYEDNTEQQIINSQVSVGHDLLHSEDRKINSPRVSDESEEYKIAANSSEEVNSPGVDGLSNTLGPSVNLASENDQIRTGYGRSSVEGTQELYNNKNSIISVSGNDHAITGTKISNYKDQTGDIAHGTTFTTQLEEPANDQSNWNQGYDDMTYQAIMQTESNEDGYSSSSESQEDVESTAAKPEYFDVRSESDRVLTSEETQTQKPSTDDYSDIVVITNGYFTSQAYDDFGKNNNEAIPATGTASGSGVMQHDTHDSISYDAKQMESELQNENVAESVDKAATEDHFEDGKSSSYSIHQSGHENLEKLPKVPSHQSLEINDERGDDLVGSAELKEPNVSCTCTKSKDAIETLREPEKSLIEVIGKSETASPEQKSVTSDTEDNYKTDSSTVEYSQIPNEKVSNKAADDLLLISTDGKRSEESYGDVSYSESRSIEYSAEESPAVFSQKNSAPPADDLVETQKDGNFRENERNSYYHRTGEEPADFMIDNIPTRYFSPNDRVLDYFKKHSQNLVGNFDPAKYQQQITQAAPIHPVASQRESQYDTPTIYHTEIDHDESTESGYQGFHSGLESEEMTTPPKEGSDWHDLESGYSYESTNSDATTSQEIPSAADELLIQAPRYEERNNIQVSKCAGENTERQKVVLNRPGDDDSNGKSAELQKPIGESGIVESGQILETNFTPEGNMPPSDYHEELFPKVNTDQEDEIYHGNISGDYAEEFLSSEESKFSEESESTPQKEGPSAGDEIETNSDTKKLTSDEASSAENARPTEINGSYKNNVEKIHHLLESDDETSEVSTEDPSSEIYPLEENHSSIKPIKESVPTHAPIDISSADHSYSAESTEGSILIGKSQEQDVRSDNGRSEIIHIHNGFSPDIYDYEDSTEGSRSTEDSIESSTDYSAKNLSERLGNAESARETISPCSHRVVVQKSTENSSDDNEKHLSNEFLNSHSKEDIKTNGETIQNNFGDTERSTFGSGKQRMLDHSQIIHHGNSYTQSKSGIGDNEKTSLNQYVANENHMMQSTTQTSVANQSGVFLQQAVETTEKDDSDMNNDDDGGNVPDKPGRSEAQDGSHPEDASEKKSGGAEKVQLVSNSQLSGCCTKPPEVQDDPGYLGRLEPKKFNPDVKSLGDLVDSDLFYIGDGVKLPLTVKKLKDGSFALSISDLICRKRSREKCPCCVPRKGEILQETRAEENAKESSNGKNNPSSLHRRAIPDYEQSGIRKTGLGDYKALVDDKQEKKMRDPELNEDQRTQDRVRRITRSVSMPVEKFAEKYNLILDLKDQLADDLENVEAADSPLKHNVIQRDEARDDTEQTFVQKLELIHEVPKNRREDTLLSTIEDLMATEPEEVIRAVNGLETELKIPKFPKDHHEDGPKARYGYQRDNPILDRIEIIKSLQQDANGCERRYQKECDDAITQKTEILKMILRWLKDLVESESNRSKKT